MERALYNGVISGVSLDGRSFFYENRLTTAGDHHRQEWFGCACCPPNIARLLASIGGYIYSTSENELYVHLYAQSKAELSIDGQPVVVEQRTRYPWDGKIDIKLSGAARRKFALMLRIPDWCRSWSLVGSYDAKAIKAKIVAGYLRVEREWGKSDGVTFKMEMPVERIHANPGVRQDVGRVALRRGPVVYCVEEADLGASPHRLLLPDASSLRSAYKPDLLGGVVVITGAGELLNDSGWGATLYRNAEPKTRKTRFTAVPYCAWDNRSPGGMAVWLARK
jgi:DUF1680 family protein